MSPEQLGIWSWASQRTVAGGTRLQEGVWDGGQQVGAGEWGRKLGLATGGGSGRLRGSGRTEAGGEGRGWDFGGGITSWGCVGGGPTVMGEK